MTFKYSYEECLACENLIKHNMCEGLFALTCKIYGSDKTVRLSTTVSANCHHYKPKGEVMGKKLTDFTKEELDTKRFKRKCWSSDGATLLKDVSFSYLSAIADDWEIVPEKKKIEIYVYKSLLSSEIRALNEKLTSENWELLETMTKEYEV